MKILILLLTIANPLLCYSQDTIPVVLFERVSDVPESKLPILIFQDNLVCDTLQGAIQVSVTFDKNINNKTINVINVEVDRVVLTNHNIQIDSRLNDCDKMNAKEKEICKKYCKIFKDLYMKQPYNDLKGREYHLGSKLGFMYKFTIVPLITGK